MKAWNKYLELAAGVKPTKHNLHMFKAIYKSK